MDKSLKFRVRNKLTTAKTRRINHLVMLKMIKTFGPQKVNENNGDKTQNHQTLISEMELLFFKVAIAVSKSPQIECLSRSDSMCTAKLSKLKN